VESRVCAVSHRNTNRQLCPFLNLLGNFKGH
jgi:hypothetical protein